MDGSPFRPPEYDGEWCKRCNRAVVVGFDLPDEMWESVVRGRWNVVCLPCFDEESTGTGLHWQRSVELYPVSRAMVETPANKA